MDSLFAWQLHDTGNIWWSQVDFGYKEVRHFTHIPTDIESHTRQKTSKYGLCVTGNSFSTTHPNCPKLMFRWYSWSSASTSKALSHVSMGDEACEQPSMSELNLVLDWLATFGWQTKELDGGTGRWMRSHCRASKKAAFQNRKDCQIACSRR